MRRSTRSAIMATAAASVLLPLTVACGAVAKAIDCGQLAVDITADAQQLSNALANAEDNPQAAKTALDQLERSMDKLGNKTDNVDVKNAVDNLADQVEETNDALEAGRIPSGQGITDAAAEVTDVCTPG